MSKHPFGVMLHLHRKMFRGMYRNFPISILYWVILFFLCSLLIPGLVIFIAINYKKKEKIQNVKMDKLVFIGFVFWIVLISVVEISVNIKTEWGIKRYLNNPNRGNYNSLTHVDPMTAEAALLNYKPKFSSIDEGHTLEYIIDDLAGQIGSYQKHQVIGQLNTKAVNDSYNHFYIEWTVPTKKGTLDLVYDCYVEYDFTGDFTPYSQDARNLQ